MLVYVHNIIKRIWFEPFSFFWSPAAAVITGADPPLNDGYHINTSSTFQAGGAVWTYTRGPVETLECPGPLNESVHIQVKGALHGSTYAY